MSIGKITEKDTKDQVLFRKLVRIVEGIVKLSTGDYVLCKFDSTQNL